MTDRELLELAAKGAGIEGQFTLGSGNALELAKPRGFQVYWNPLTDDGDALRLAVKLGIDLVRLNLPTGVGISAYDGKAPSAFERYTDDPCAATRRAIVRAAAEVGKQMGGSDD